MSKREHELLKRLEDAEAMASRHAERAQMWMNDNQNLMREIALMHDEIRKIREDVAHLMRYSQYLGTGQ